MIARHFRVFHPIGWFLCSLFFALHSLAAEDTATSPSTPPAPPKVDTSQGPTVVRARITVIDEYTRAADGAYRNRLLLQGTAGLGEKRDYGLTVELPIVHYEPGSSGGQESASGLGDIRTFLIRAFHRRGDFTHSWVLESYLNTSGEKFKLGAGATTLLPSYALTYRHSKSAQIFLLNQFEFDVQRDSGVDPVRRLAIRPFALLNFPQYWYSFLELKNVIDFENDNKLAVTGTASLGKFLGEKRKISVFGVVGGPLNDYARDQLQRYQFKLGANFFL